MFSVSLSGLIQCPIFFLLSVNQADVCLVAFSPLCEGRVSELSADIKIRYSNLNCGNYQGQSSLRPAESTDTVLLIVTADFK